MRSAFAQQTHRAVRCGEQVGTHISHQPPTEAPRAVHSTPGITSAFPGVNIIFEERRKKKMKGKKMVFAVMLSLIVCLLLVSTCAYATEVEPVPENSDVVVLPTVPDGDASKVPAAPVVIGDLDDDDTADAPDGGDDGDDEIIPDTDEDEGGEDSTIPGDDDDTTKKPGSDEEGESTIPGDSDDDDEDEDENENNANKDKPANNGGGSDNHTPSDNAPSNNGGNTGDNTNKGFQVELTYNDKVVKKDGLKGGESFDLAELLRELGIDGELTEAKGNADDLFDAVKGEDGWKFNTKMAFGDPYELVVTVDGVQYVITVTDDGNTIIADGKKTLQSLINDAAKGVTIKLQANYTEHLEIAVGKQIIIDLNGYTLKGDGKGSTINNCGHLTIRDTSANKTGTLSTPGGTWNFALMNYSGATAILESGTITRESSTKRLIGNDGTMVVKDGVILDGNGYNTYLIESGNNNRGKESLRIEGGVFSNDGKKIIYSDAKLEISGGEFGDGSYYVGDKSKNEDQTLNITGGVFENDSLLKNLDDDTVVVKSGDKYAVNESAYDIAKEGETLEIVKAPANAKIDNAPAGITVKNSTGNTIIINGVEIKNDETVITVAPATKSAGATNSCDIPMFKYCVVDGKDAEWTKGSAKTLNYVLNADANNLIKVLIDGEEVEFEIDENGEVVISAEVLEKLDAGEYEIEFIFADGSCKTKLFVK